MSAIPTSLLQPPIASLAAYLEWADGAPDEMQFEVVGGRPVVNPVPGAPHQQLVMLVALLVAPAAARAGLAPLPAPVDWVLWELPSLTVRQPDLVLVEPDQAVLPRLVTPPALAVEILSPSSVERDVVTKRLEYARAGLPHYWLVDPVGPAVTIYRLEDDVLQEVGQASSGRPLAVEAPVQITIDVARLRA